MKFRKPTWWMLLVTAGLFVVIVLLLIRSRGNPVPEGVTENIEVTADVQVDTIRQDTLVTTLQAYGRVIAAPGKSDIYNVPFEASIRKILVTEGARVQQGDLLLTLEASPDTRLAFKEAKDELTTANDQLKLTRERVKLKLATQQEVVDATQRANAAELRVKSYSERGVEGVRRVTAKGAGIISALPVQQGQIVPAGDELAGIVAEGDIQVQLGIESEDVGSLSDSQEVYLWPVNAVDGDSMRGTIVRITHSVNPATRLVDVYVMPLDHHTFLLNDYIRAKIKVAAGEGWIVPRSSVLPDEEGFYLFTVVQGRAVLHHVERLLENDQEIQVAGKDLASGLLVVTSGNSELEDGMRVHLDPVP